MRVQRYNNSTTVTICNFMDAYSWGNLRAHRETTVPSWGNLAAPRETTVPKWGHFLTVFPPSAKNS